MFGRRCVVGVGCVFARVLFVDMRVMRGFGVGFRGGRRFRRGSDGGFDRLRNRRCGRSFYRRRFARDRRVVVLIMCMMLVFVGVLMSMIMIVRMLMTVMIMMLGIGVGMPGIVRMGVRVFGVLVILMRLGGL